MTFGFKLADDPYIGKICGEINEVDDSCCCGCPGGGAAALG